VHTLLLFLVVVLVRLAAWLEKSVVNVSYRVRGQSVARLQ